VKTFRTRLGDRELVALTNPMQAFIEAAGTEVCRVREEAIKTIVESLGISVDDLSRRLETLSDRGERIEFLRKFLNDHGYHIEIETGGYNPSLVSEERINVWKLERVVELKTVLRQENNHTGVGLYVDTTMVDIMKQG